MKNLLRLLAVLILTAAAFAQNDIIVPNENLVAEGIPKIPAALAESVGRYSEFRTASFESWNPASSCTIATAGGTVCCSSAGRVGPACPAWPWVTVMVPSWIVASATPAFAPGTLPVRAPDHSLAVNSVTLTSA